MAWYDDLGSMASSIAPVIAPALAGVALGGRNRGLMGAYGLATGLSRQAETQTADETRRNLFQNQQRQIEMEQQRNDISQQQANAQIQHWGVVEKQIGQQMQTEEQTRLQKAKQFEWISSDREASDQYAKGIKDEAERLRFQVDPKAFLTEKMDEFTDQNKRSIAATIAGHYSLPKGITAEQWVQHLGKKGFSAWLENEQKHLHALQEKGAEAAGNKFGYTYSPEYDGFFITNRHDNSISFKSVADIGGGGKNLSDANRIKAQGVMGRAYEAERKDNPEMLQTSYNDWFQRPENQLRYKSIAGLVTPEEFEKGSAAITRRKQLDESVGFEKAKKAYFKANNLTSGDPSAEAQWDKYRGGPGFRRVAEYQDVERRTSGEFNEASQGTEQKGAPSGEPKDFASWKAKYAPHDSGQDYDLEGAYKAGLVPTNGHFPDTFKKPGHPRFSIESKYWKPGMPAGRWEGENYIPMDAKTAAAWVKTHGQNMTPDKPKAQSGNRPSLDAIFGN